MPTVTENFEKTLDGKLPPQDLAAGHPSPVLEFPTMNVLTRREVVRYAPESAGIELKGNFFGLPIHEGSGGLTMTLKQPALAVSFDYWIAGLVWIPNKLRIAAFYYGDGTNLLGQIELPAKDSSYSGSVLFTTPDPAKRIRNIVFQSMVHPSAINHVVMTV